MFVKISTKLAAALLSVSLLAACGGHAQEQGRAAPGAETGTPVAAGGAENKPKEPAISTDPVTVKLYTAMTFTDPDFDKLVIQPVKKAYPHITIQRLTGNIDNLIAAGDTPDIVQTHNGAIADFTDKGLMSDLGALIQKHNFDLGRFENSVIASLKNDKGQLLALPYAVNFTALYYNKDLFDKFGVPYPKDGMTWDETIELAKKLTRQEGGVKYRGLDPEGLIRLVRQMGIDFSDDKTMKATVNNDTFRNLFELLKNVYTIPGNEVADVTNSKGKDGFLKDRTVAMFPTVNLFDVLGDSTKSGLNWDVVEYPSMKGRPHLTTDVDAHLFAISSASKNKDAAMQVIATVLSNEVQRISARDTARMTALKDPSFQKEFAAGLGFIQGKNLAGVFLGKSVPAPIRSKHYSKTREITNKKFKDFVDGTKDLNTALREADEEINLYLSSQAKK